MRNLGAYPVTHAEKINFLRKLYETEIAPRPVDQMMFGSMKPAIILDIIKDMYRLSAKEEGIAPDPKLEPLETIVKKFMADNYINCVETIYQTDRVAVNSLEFIEALCEMVGYPINEDDEDEADED